MIGDYVFITNQDKKRAKILLSKITILPTKSVVTIGGGSGTKKSELEICIQEVLYKNNILSLGISLDDCYSLHFNFRNDERKTKGLKTIGTKEINWILVKTAIKNFKKGKKLSLQVINKYTNSFMLETVDSRGIQYLIVEGLYANYLKKFGLSDYAIHLTGTPEQTLKFRKRRNKENEIDKFRKKVVQKEYQEVLKLKKYADIVL